MSDDYDEETGAVGYGRPPRQHQFKPGQSGNPRGRSRGALGLKAILATELATKVKMSRDGKVIHLSKLQIAVKRLVDKAALGDLRAIEKLIELNMRLFGLEEQPAERVLTADEQNFITTMLSPGPLSDAAAGHIAPTIDHADQSKPAAKGD